MKHKDISRIDQESKSTFGYYVRVNFKGETRCKFFSDGRCGSKKMALLRALEWRNATEKKIGKPRTDRHYVSVARTNTGIVGVRFNEKLARYEVSWVTTEGKQGKTSVSINRLGKKAAFTKACGIRSHKDAERLSARP